MNPSSRQTLQRPQRSHNAVAARGAALLVVLLRLAPTALAAPPADDGPQPAPDGATAVAGEAGEASFFDSTTVTATGSEREVFQVATPVTVVTAEEIDRLAPDNAADLLREQPGVDVNGVGPNQARPVIRGQRGLRVLFLQDGLRLNNARRQTDFGEITGLVEIDSVAAVEVVRGPASVLYGSDAVGGVLNLVTRGPSFAGGRDTLGSFELRYGEAGDSERAAAQAAARRGAFDFELGGALRDADDYDAPAGSFGEVTLADDVTVLDTGVEDSSLWAGIGWTIDESRSLRLRFNRYRAEQTGFGFVEPELIGADDPARVRILYPFQDFDRWALYYLGTLGAAVADTVDAKLYWQSNERALVNDIDIDIGPVFPGAPSSSVLADTENHTDLDTLGLRLEAVKAFAGGDQILTYGVEGYRDRSRNRDSSVTTTIFRFPFPPSVIGVIPGFTCVDFVPPFECSFTSTDSLANAPNAENTSWGVFVQDEWTAGPRLRATGGLRYQSVETRAEATPGWDVDGLDFADDALVGSLTGTWQLLPELNLLASYGTAFRAPNIVERLFNGLTPEGIGFQLLNPDLESETSDNFDLGLKYRRSNAFVELVAFRTEISDGIVQYTLSDEEIAALPPDVREEVEATGVDFVVQQRNVERLRYDGVELAAGYRTRDGWVFGGNYTWLDAERLDTTALPVGDTYGDKLSAYVRWEPARRPLWIEYRLRHIASSPAALGPSDPVPAIGATLPSFTVHTLAGGGTIFARGRFAHELRIAVENLTDELYAEVSNATFFRPEPGRSVSASWRVTY